MDVPRLVLICVLLQGWDLSEVWASRGGWPPIVANDPVGNLPTEKGGRVTGKPFDIRNTYDDLNRLRSVEDGEGNITRFEYDGEGNRTAQIEPEDQRTEFDYGELNELIEVRMADGGIFQYLYDPNRNRIKQIDAESNVVEFTYDNLNRLDRMIQDPTGFAYITDYDYDANGNETKLTDAKDQVIDFTYDELNRMTAKVYQLTPDDFALYTRTNRIDYGYDANDNLRQVDELRSSGTDPPAAYTSFKIYDNLDRVTSETDTFGRTLEYGYDPQGNRNSLTDPDGIETSYTYDALNRLETLTTAAGTTTYTYFPDGLKESVSNPNNTTSTFGYDAADRMTSIDHQGPSGTVSAFAYTYTPNSNRETQVETNAGTTQTTSYTYDPVNRLQTVTYEDSTPNARTTTYEYDLAGNRKTEQEVELSTSNIRKDLEYNYDAINRLGTITDNLGDDDVAYAYDPNGNTTSKTKNGVTTTFKYDIRDQLGEVLQGSNILGRYGYDYDGRRILKIGADGRRHYTYDQLSVITEADETNDTVSKYDYGLDQLVSLDNQLEGRSFFHLDALRSTVNLTDGFGGTRQSILYDAWGNERDRIGTSANKFTFTGHEKDDETGLVYAKARFYDPEIGRFLSQDALLGEPETTPSLNRYSYVGNRPTVKLDPYGLYGEDVHRGLTYFLASRGAGFNEREAKQLGQFSQSIDENPETAPVQKGVEIELRKQLKEDKFLGADIRRYKGLVSRVDKSRRLVSELERELSEWHLPKGAGERFVEAGSQAAGSKVKQATNLAEAARITGLEPNSPVYNDALRDFGRGLHPLQDSFSHEGGQYAHPFRGSPGDLDYSTPLRSNTDWTHTTPEKSKRMARRVLEEMLEFRRARGDKNVPSIDAAWNEVRNDVDEFIHADTRREKEEILNRWGVEQGTKGKWGISAPEGEDIPTEQHGVWDKIWSYTKEKTNRRIVDALRGVAEGEIRSRLQKELLEERQAREQEEKRKHIVVPEMPEGN